MVSSCDAQQLAEHIVNGKDAITKESLLILLVTDSGTLRTLGIALNVLYELGYYVKAGW